MLPFFHPIIDLQHISKHLRSCHKPVSYTHLDVYKRQPEYIRGDVDADRKVSIGDVRMTLRSICKKAELNGTQKLAADVEKDGTVDIKDLRKILRYVCGKIEYL